MGKSSSLAAIALGSNLGNSRQILDLAIDRLNATPGICVTGRSSWYRTAPVGPPQPDYLNGAVTLEVCLPPHQLLDIMLKIEADFGRRRGQHWGPRTLDLDLLLFDRLILDTPTLQIPHPRMGERAFVLVPLAEIAPERIEPVSGKTIAQLLLGVDRSGIRPI